MQWTQATDSAGWSARAGQAVVFDNKMWMLGGVGNGDTLKNDVWYSINGIDWILATDSAGWSKRAGHASEVFDNKMWVLGGVNEQGWKIDVWDKLDFSDRFGRLVSKSLSDCGCL
jgi:hypothetical protein